MSHRPVCVKCRVEFFPSGNGIVVVDYVSFGAYKIWQADEYECPICHHKIVVGFAENPYFEHFEPGFRDHLNKIKAEGKIKVIENFEVID